MSRFHKQAWDTKLFVTAPGVLARNVGRDLILAAVGQEGFEVLSPTAADVWRLLDKPRTLEQLVETLSTDYGAEKEVITRDVEELVTHLLERGLIQSVADHLEEVPKARA